jgi:hypothetical protein
VGGAVHTRRESAEGREGAAVFGWSGEPITVRDGRHRRMSLRRDDLEERFPGLLTVILGGAPVAAGR